MLHGLVITNPCRPPTDFESAPWNDTALVAPRHAVRRLWSDSASRKLPAAPVVSLQKLPAYILVKLNSSEDERGVERGAIKRLEKPVTVTTLTR